MLRLQFVCQFSSLKSDAYIKAVQTDIWQRCDRKSIGGFLVQHATALVGVFEGEERPVVGCVEQLIRKHKVMSVNVMREETVQSRRWPVWNTQHRTLNGLRRDEAPQIVTLAQAMMDAVEAIQGRR